MPDRHEGKELAPGNKHTPENTAGLRQNGLLSRRRLLASLGIAGAGAALLGTMNGNEWASNVFGSVVDATISELRSLTQPSRLHLLCDVTDTGKKVHFVYDPIDTASADNTGLVLVSTGGERFKRIVVTEYYGVK
jgi:hypothetical protein